MGLPFKKLLMGAGEEEISWLIRDDFNDARAAGSFNGTPATPGPGTRTVTDTLSRWSISGGALQQTLAGASVQDPRVLYDAISRTAGRLMVAEVTRGAANMAYQPGWTNSVGLIYNRNETLFLRNNNKIYWKAAAEIIVGAWAQSNTYYVAIVLRTTGAYMFIKGGAYTNWTLLYIEPDDAEASLYPALGGHNIDGQKSMSFIRVPDELWLPTPSTYDTFTRANGSLGNSEGTGPDSQGVTARAWTGSTFTIDTNKAINTPTQGAEIISDPGLEGAYVAGMAPPFGSCADGTPTEEGVIVHGGSKSQQVDWVTGTSILSQPLAASSEWFIYTGWIQNSASMWVDLMIGVHSLAIDASGSFAQFVMTGRRGNWFPTYNTDQANTYYVDDISLKQLTLSELFASLETNEDDVIVEVDLVITEGTQGGLVLRLDSAGSPANFIIAYHDGVNAHLEKCVAGTYTSLITEAATYAANATLRVVLDGSAVSLFYNDDQIGSKQTVSDAGILNNTLHGLFSTYASNTMDKFLVMPNGNNEEYSRLDRYIE